MGFVVAVPPSRSSINGRLHWYAILHRFSDDGKHLGTKAAYLGLAEFASDLDNPKDTVRKMIRELGPVTYEDIRVRHFKTKIDGHVFGLIKLWAQAKGGSSTTVL